MRKIAINQRVSSNLQRRRAMMFPALDRFGPAWSSFEV